MRYPLRLRSSDRFSQSMPGSATSLQLPFAGATKLTDNSHTSGLGEELLDTADGNASVVGLNSNLGDLAVFDEDGGTLRTLVAENRGGIELDVESVGELASSIAEEGDLGIIAGELDARLLLEALGPSIHARRQLLVD